jgi:hypothetical protein
VCAFAASLLALVAVVTEPFTMGCNGIAVAKWIVAVTSAAVTTGKADAARRSMVIDPPSFEPL